MKRIIPIFLLIPFLMGAASRNFDGSGDRLGQGDIFDVGTGDITICMWAKTTEDASQDAIIGSRNIGGGNEGYSIYQNASDVMLFEIEEQAGAGGSVVTATGATDTDGVWYPVCGTWDGTNDIATIFINGISEGSTDSSGIGSLAGGTFFRMGADGAATAAYDANGNLAYGTVYDAIIFNAQQLAEWQWKPEINSVAVNMLIPVWGDSPEIDLSAVDDTASVTNTTASTDGPPVMFGGGLPL